MNHRKLTRETDSKAPKSKIRPSVLPNIPVRANTCRLAQLANCGLPHPRPSQLSSTPKRGIWDVPPSPHCGNRHLFAEDDALKWECDLKPWLHFGLVNKFFKK